MKNTIYILLLLVISCGGNPTPNPDADPRLPFIGTYNMTKLENGNTYSMTIDTLGGHCDCSSCDSIEVNNFCDLFNFAFSYACWVPSNSFHWYSIPPITDKFGRRWNFSETWVGVEPPENYNKIYGDSIKINFRIDNILYYFADGVPYLDTIYTHVGKRQ